ncbi:hypothetical protein HYC85_006780 [Camellia sinensis]|uniref:PHD-type domain-containing protein n=1 Tax=Camellia sinensis TaxID=4442 RepID=A0A7J7HPI7_CAMSI|nr:hypothetical protein HYC85_006780 [Camellia sinensis]
MKRELAFVLQTQCELAGSLGRTRASKVHTWSVDLNGLSEDRSSKRFKGSVVKDSDSNGEIDGSQSRDQNQETVRVYRRTRRFKNADSGVEHKVSLVERLETVIEDKTKCNLVMCEDENKGEFTEALSKEELRVGSENPTVNEGGSEAVPMAVHENVEARNDENNGSSNDATNEVRNDLNNEVICDVLVEGFTETALNSKSEVEVVKCSGLVAADGGENETVTNVEVNESGSVNALGTPTKKLELKMSKKIALGRTPKTVKELFATGLLEGYSVFYNGGDKGFRGMIKDVGILCFCRLCNGSRVVNPCQFEIHACKSYRRAAQYICLENGKSLLQVLKACRNSPVDTLEETIQSFIGPLAVKESIICQNCNGSFLATIAEKVEQLCQSCVGLKSLEATPSHATDTNDTSFKLALALRKSTRSAKAGISSQDRSEGRVTKKRSLKPALAPKSSGSASVHIFSGKRSQGRIAQKSSKAVLIARPSKSASPSISSQKKSKWKITKKFVYNYVWLGDLRLHKLVFEDNGLPDGTEVAYYSQGQKLLEGFKRGLGILCRCCNLEVFFFLHSDLLKILLRVFIFITMNEQVSPSQFEVHAGWASRKKPYQYIYTSNGVSLHEFAISLLKGRKHSAKDNDDLCTICADGGNLLLCDVCPRAFHIECASLSSIPRGKWYCKYCQNMFQREKFVEHNANAVAAGRVSGVDLIEQITKRCIRIVKNPEDAEVIACVLCRGYQFRKSGFGPHTVIVCDQCEKEYHVGCLKKHKMDDLKELPEGKWFCCMVCRRIYSALQNLLVRGEEKIPDSLLDVIKKKHEEKVSDTVTDFDVRWRILSGTIASPETRLLLSKAVAIFHDCFDPIVDSATGRDFIPSMVYGRNIRGQDFAGMYCAVLTIKLSVTGFFPYHAVHQLCQLESSEFLDRKLQELPLVATSNGNQGKGYFQILFSCIEKLLAFLNVKSLLSDYRKTCWQMLTFQGTAMLQKRVPQCRITQQDGVDVPMESS